MSTIFYKACNVRTLHCFNINAQCSICELNCGYSKRESVWPIHKMSFAVLLVSKKLKGDINNLSALGLHPPVVVVCCLLGGKEDKGTIVS